MTTETDSSLGYQNLDKVELYSKVNPNRDVPRYIFCMGDHIEAKDKISFNSLIGGIWVGSSEVEGAPTMRRTNFMIHTCGIIPLETTAIGKKADHQAEKKSDEQLLIGKGVPAGTRGYTVYAGDTLAFLQSDRFRPLGVVELTHLAGKDWTLGIAEKFQRFYFPEWVSWKSGAKPFPTRLQDREAYVREAMAKAGAGSPEASVGIEMLESSRLFSQFAQKYIERNRQVIMSNRSTNTGGFFFGWTEKSRLFAEQLGIKLEDEAGLRKEDSSSTSNPDLVEAMKADQELRREEMAAQREQIKLLTMLVAGKIPSLDALQEFLPNTEKVLAKEEIQAPSLEIIEEVPDVSFGSDSEEIELVKEPIQTPAEVETTFEQPTEKLGMFKEPLVPDGQCHGKREKTGERCSVTITRANSANEPGQGLYCSRHIPKD